MKKYLSLAATAALAAALLTGCGDSSSSSSTNDNVKYGQLVDAPVAGVDYTCGDLSGQTDDNGTFAYNEGDTCTFAVAGVTLGTVEPKPIVTPVDLANNDPEKAIEIARILIASDSDNNPDNGIQVSTQTFEVLQQAGITDLQTAPVTTLQEVATQINAPSTDEVIAHLEQNGITLPATNLPATGTAETVDNGNLPSLTGTTPTETPTEEMAPTTEGNLPTLGGDVTNTNTEPTINPADLVSEPDTTTPPAAPTDTTETDNNLPTTGDAETIDNTGDVPPPPPTDTTTEETTTNTDNAGDVPPPPPAG